MPVGSVLEKNHYNCFFFLFGGGGGLKQETEKNGASPVQQIIYFGEK